MRYFLICFCLLLSFMPIQAAPNFNEADVADLARLERHMERGRPAHDRLLSDRNLNERRVLDSNLSPDAKKKAIERINNNYGRKSRAITAKFREPYIKKLMKMVPGLTESAGSTFRVDGELNPEHRGWTGDFDFEGSTLDVYRKNDAIEAARSHNIEHIRQQHTSSTEDRTPLEIAADNQRANEAIEVYKRERPVSGISVTDPSAKTSDVSFGAAETTANFDSTTKTLRRKKEAAIALLEQELAQGSYQNRHGNTIEFGPDSKQEKVHLENLEQARDALTDIENNPGKYDSFDRAGDSSHEASERLRNRSLETSAEFGMGDNQHGKAYIKSNSLFQKGAAGLTMSGAQLVDPRHVAEMQGMVKAASKTINDKNPILSSERTKELAIKNGLITDGPNSQKQMDELKADLANRKKNPHFENMPPAEAENLKNFSKDLLLETIDESRVQLRQGEQEALDRIEVEAQNVQKKQQALQRVEKKHGDIESFPKDPDGKPIIPEDLKKVRAEFDNAKQTLKISQEQIVDTKVKQNAADAANKAALENLQVVRTTTEILPTVHGPADGPDTPGGAKQTLKKAVDAGKKAKDIYQKQMAKGARKGFVRGGGVAALFGIYQTVNQKGQEVYDRSPDASNTELVAETMWETGKELSNYNKLKGIYRQAADTAHQNYKSVEKGNFNDNTGGLASFFGNLTWGMGVLAYDELKGMTVDVYESAKTAVYEGVLLGDALLKEVDSTMQASSTLQKSVDAQLAQLAAEEAGADQKAETPGATVATTDAWTADTSTVTALPTPEPKLVTTSNPDDVWGEVSDHKELPAEGALDPSVGSEEPEEQDIWAEGDDSDQVRQAQNRYRLEQQLAQDKAQAAANNDRQNRQSFAQAQVRREEEARITAEKKAAWGEFANAFTGALTQVATQIQQAKNTNTGSGQSVQVGDYSAVNAYDRKVQNCVSNSGRPGFPVTDIHAAKIGCSQKLGPRPRPSFKAEAGSAASNYGSSSGSSSSSSWGGDYSNNTDGQAPNYDGLTVGDNRSASEYGSTSDAWGTTAPVTNWQEKAAPAAKVPVNICGVMAVKLGPDEGMPRNQWIYNKSDIGFKVSRLINKPSVYESIEFKADCSKLAEWLRVDDESMMRRKWSRAYGYLTAEIREWPNSRRRIVKNFKSDGTLGRHIIIDADGTETNLTK